MKPLLTLLRRPLRHVAALSFFVNLLLAPALFMLQVELRALNRFALAAHNVHMVSP